METQKRIRPRKGGGKELKRVKSLEERIAELEEKVSRLESLIPDETMKEDFWEKVYEGIRQGLTHRSANHDTSEKS